MTPLALVQRELQMLELEPQVQRELELVLELEPVLGLEPQEQLGQEPKMSETHVFLARLPLRRGSTQHI